MIRVVVPHGVTTIGHNDGRAPAIEALPFVRMNLAMQGIDATYVPMTNDHSYVELLADLWDDGEPFVIVEHDILPWPGAIAELEDDGVWCGFAYALSGGLDTFLGCTKIDPRAIGFPRELDREGATYQTCDIAIAAAFQRAGYFLHHHGPPVIHLHEGYDASRWRGEGKLRLACGCEGEPIGGHAGELARA